MLSNYSWDISEDEAIALQVKHSSLVKKEDQFDKEIRLVAGVDVAYDKSNTIFAAAVVIDINTMAKIEIAAVKGVVRFPYIPGLFAFREVPPICDALSKLSNKPDLIVCDGHGVAHPRRFGIACHLGLIYDLPTIGCAKSRLIGEYSNLGYKRGNKVPLLDKKEIIGKVLRTRDGINPLFISTGHRVSSSTACDLILKLSPKYRLPETTRFADQTANKLRKASYDEE